MKIKKIIFYLLLSICINAQLHEGSKYEKENLLYTGSSMMNMNGASGQVKFKPYFGQSSPQGDSREISESGFNFGLGLDYSISEELGIGLDVNYKSFDFVYQVPGTLGVDLEQHGDSQWNQFTVGIGPRFQFRVNRIEMAMSTIAGFSFMANPMISSKVLNTEVFSTGNEHSRSFNLDFGTSISYPVSDQVSFFVSPKYSVSTGSKLSYKYKDIKQAINPATGIIDPDLLGDLSYQERSVDFSAFTIKIGFSINLGSSSNYPSKGIAYEDYYIPAGNKQTNGMRKKNNRGNSVQCCCNHLLTAPNPLQDNRKNFGGDNGNRSTDAQDYNSSRSNNDGVAVPDDKSSGRATGRRQHGSVDSGNNTNSGSRKSNAQDYNSSRSNNGASKAQDYNSSRSNNDGVAVPDDKSSGRATGRRQHGSVDSGNNTNSGSRKSNAQDYNSSRSNNESRKSEVDPKSNVKKSKIEKYENE